MSAFGHVEREAAKDAEIERLRAELNGARYIATEMQIKSASNYWEKENERLRAELAEARDQQIDAVNKMLQAERELAAERERCAKIAEIPLTPEQIEQLNVGLGCIMPGSQVYNVAQQQIAAAIRRGEP